MNHKEQLLRANQPNVTAFINSYTPNSKNGKIPHGRIEVSAYCIGNNLDHYCDISGDETGTTEIIHIFTNPLPYIWYMPLIPNWVINRPYARIPKFIKKYLVVRTQTVVLENEYNVEKPVISLKSASESYRHFNLSVTINFGDGTIPSNLIVRRINKSSVIDIPFERRPSERCAVIRLDKMTVETLRITWTPT